MKIPIFLASIAQKADPESSPGTAFFCFMGLFTPAQYARFVGVMGNRWIYGAFVGAVGVRWIIKLLTPI